MGDERYELEKVSPQDEAPLARPGYPRITGYPDMGAYGYGYGAEKGAVNLHNIWRIIRKRKWLILVITVIVTSVATVEVYRTKSLYQATASVEVRRESTTLVKTADVLVQSDDLDMMNTYMFTIKSRPLLQDVATNLKLDQNPQFLNVTQRKSIWEALRTIGNKFGLSAPAIGADPASNTAATSQAGGDETARLAPYVGVLTANLRVDQVPRARLLAISFVHTEPDIAAKVANGVAETFIDRNFTSKTQKYTRATEWLDRRTRELKAKVEQSEKALADYVRDQGFSFSGGKENLATDKFLRLHDQVQRAETDRALKQSLYEVVKAGNVDQLPETYTDAQLGELQKKLRELKITAAELDVKFGRNNPKVVEVAQKIAALETQIETSRRTLESRLRAEYEQALRQEKALKEILERTKSETAQQNQAEIKFNLLKQEVDTNKSLYTEFLQKTSQADIQLAEQHNNLSLAEPAVSPNSPIGPQRLRTILIWLFLSLTGGVGLAFFLEYLDNTIKTVEDVSRYVQLPALGVIPSINDRKIRGISSSRNGKRRALAAGATNGKELVRPAGVLALDSRSSIAEAYRVLRTSVLLSSAGGPPKILLVTSGRPSEGKSTTTINTAISMAQLGAKVLIIDCDLRKPSVHRVFGIDHARGLSTYLSRDVDIEGLIQNLPIKNLSLLPSGAVPPNAAELISSEKMKHLLAMLAEQYDHILIDSPPLMHVTDPVILSTMVDGVILVVHGGKSTREMVRRSRQDLAAVGAKIFGVVLNNVDLRGDGYDDYYYDRYYGEYEQEREVTSGD
ncbi:MAG TPA: polysaccharide biosynthesis tyrosine autokinase [Blastocatellia bacterium]|nr:polysaccharide biosynthesis tyrosine autokinase [Blastocatellia bacterium]